MISTGSDSGPQSLHRSCISADAQWHESSRFHIPPWFASMDSAHDLMDLLRTLTVSLQIQHGLRHVSTSAALFQPEPAVAKSCELRTALVQFPSIFLRLWSFPRSTTNLLIFAQGCCARWPPKDVTRHTRWIRSVLAQSFLQSLVLQHL